jgi:MFS family permease
MSQKHPISEGTLPPASPPSSSSPTASVASWGAFALIGFSIAIGQGSTALVTAALSLYLRQLGAPTDRIGLEVTMTGVVVTICTIAVGPFIGRIGAKRLLLTGMAAYLVAALGMLLFPSEAAVALFRALQGVGAGLALPSALTLAPRIIPARQGTALGMMSALFTVASAVGPPLGLWLFTQGGPARLFIPAAACALVGIGLGLALPSVPRATGGWRGFGYDRRWTPELVANVLGNAYFGGIAAYLPLLLARTGGPNAGIFFTADALGVLILRVPSGMIVDRSGPRMAEALGIVLTLLGVGALFLPASIVTLALAGAGTGTGAGLLITAVLVSLTGRSDEHNRGTAMGLSTAAYNVGIFLGGAIAGPVASVAGFHGVLGVGLIATALALPIVLVAHARVPAAVLKGE